MMVINHAYLQRILGRFKVVKIKNFSSRKKTSQAVAHIVGKKKQLLDLKVCFSKYFSNQKTNQLEVWNEVGKYQALPSFWLI